MFKEIDVLKNLIVAMDAEEAARHRLERERERYIQTHTWSLNGADLPKYLADAIEAWSKAFNDLNGARGIAKHLIRNHEAAFAEAVARRPHQVKRECSDCDGEPGSCHMNCGPAVARSK